MECADDFDRIRSQTNYTKEAPNSEFCSEILEVDLRLKSIQLKFNLKKRQ